MNNFIPNHEEIVVHLESGAKITLTVPAPISILEIRSGEHFVQYRMNPYDTVTHNPQFPVDEAWQDAESLWDNPEPPDFPEDIDSDEVYPLESPYDFHPYAFCKQCEMPVLIKDHELAHPETGGEWESIPWCSDCRDYHSSFL